MLIMIRLMALYAYTQTGDTHNDSILDKVVSKVRIKKEKEDK